MEQKSDLGIVVCYYYNGGSEESRRLLLTTTELSLRLLKMNKCVASIILSDGSKNADDNLREICFKTGVRYCHFGKEVGYAEAYNLGWNMLTEPYIGLIANDIIPYPPETISILLDWVKKPDVGCVAPYFYTSRIGRDEVQRIGYWNRALQTCEPSSVTLNLNLFKRSVLEKIGGIEQNYIYGYAEPIFIIKIRTLGFRVLLIGGTCVFHYDRLTKLLKVSNLKDEHYRIDTKKWFEQYAPYASRRGIANIKLWKCPFSTTLSIKFLWWICYSCPFSFLRNIMVKIVLWLEPFFTRYPARYGKGATNV